MRRIDTSATFSKISILLAAFACASCGAGGGGGFGSAETVRFQTTSVPPATTGQPYAAQFAAAFPHPPGQFLLAGGTLPPGLALDPVTGDLAGYPTRSGTFRFEVAARDGIDRSIPQGRDAVFDQDVRRFTMDVALGPPCILPQVLPPAQYRHSYAHSIRVAGGTAPYAFAVTGGTLPKGITVDAYGSIGSFPTEARQAPYEFDVVVTDATGLQHSARLSLPVVLYPLIILTSQVPQSAQDVGYDTVLELASEGGGAPITWSQELPPGPGELDLTSFGMMIASNGHLKNRASVSGPTTLGSHLFTARVTDEANQVATRQFDLYVNPGPVLTSITPKRSTQPGPYVAKGANFQPGVRLVFKPGPTETVITPAFVDSTTLRFDAAPAPPGGSGGAVPVQAVNPDLGSHTLPAAFVFPASTIAFGAKGFLASAVSSIGLDAADVNGDGLADVVHCGAAGFLNYSTSYGGVASSSGGLILHLNQGGTPLAFGSLTLDSGAWYGVRFADVNLDGRKDVVAIGASALRVWLNGVAGDPPGTFTAGPSSPLAGGIDHPQSMTMASLNGDAVPDVVYCASVYGNYNGSVFSMTGNGSGGFAILDSATSTIPSVYGVVTVACVDVDGDGRQDVFAGKGLNYATGPLGFLALTQSNGMFGPWTSCGTTTLYYGDTTGAAAVDVHGDGSPVVVLSHYQDPSDGGSRQATMLAGSGLASQTDMAAPGTAPKQVRGMDLDFDGREDWAVAAHPDTVLVYRGASEAQVGTLTVTSGSPTISSARTGPLASADLDGDGRDDLLVGTSYFANDMQPYFYSGGYAMNLSGNGNPLGIVYYLNASN